jgi:hypothetical protein
MPASRAVFRENFEQRHTNDFGTGMTLLTGERRI